MGGDLKVIGEFSKRIQGTMEDILLSSFFFFFLNCSESLESVVHHHPISGD